MPSTRKKSPLNTSKKKKPTSKHKIKKSVSKKNVREQDVTVNNTDGSYLHDVSQATSKGDELLGIQSPTAGSAAILSMLMRLEESKIEGNSTVSSTPIYSAVASGRDNVTFRLPKPTPSSPVKTTVGDVTP